MSNLSQLSPHRNARIALSAITPDVWQQAWALASDSEWIRAIARECHVGVGEVMGPAADAAAKIIARGDDPRQHIGLVIDACRRELTAPTPLFDPQGLRETAEPITYYLQTHTRQLSYLPDERCSERTGRRRAEAKRIARGAGQMDLLLRVG